MFQMINEGSQATTEDRKMFWVKFGAFVVAMLAVGGVIYFFAFLPYAH